MMFLNGIKAFAGSTSQNIIGTLTAMAYDTFFMFNEAF
jgi:hypothetical protein